MSPHAAGAKGRLVFALDATMSRQPTWDMACALQADMFREAASLGSLDIRLVYYRGFNECRASGWISDSAQLAKLMSKIDCRGGNTQIGKVLSEARREAVASGVRAVVFVGDAMEENVDELCAKAGELGLLKVPVFMFQEGHDDDRRAGVPRDRAADRRRLVQVRSGRGGAAARAVAGRGGLCRRRTRGAEAAVGERKRRGEIARPDQVIPAFWARLTAGALYCAMPTLIAGAVAVIVLLFAAADVSRGQSGRARARHQDRRRRGRARGGRLHRLEGRTGGGDPARDFRRRTARLDAVRATGFGNIGGLFSGVGDAALGRPDLAGPLAVSRDEARSRHRPARRA